ncbi:MAG: ATP-binding protein, partial [Rhodospirillaceae bacterium]
IYADEGGTLVAANGEGRDAWRAKATVIEAPFEVTRGSLDPLDSETPKPESNAEGSGGAEPVGAEAEAVAVVEAKQAVATAFAGLLDGLEARLHDDLPDSRDLFDRLQEAERLGVSETIDLPLRDPGDPEGEPEWLRVSVTGVAGEPGARIWQSRDVTARRAIDEVLTREREELADFLFFLPVGLYSTDANGTLRYINQRLAHWLGLEPDDLGGSRIEDWVDGDPPDPDGEWEGTLTFKPRYDAPFLAAVRQSTFDDAGDIRTRSVVMRLSERVEAASEGSWSKRRPWLFDAAPVGIGLIGPDGLLTDCNTSFLDMLGRVRDDVLDRPLSEFIHAEERDAVQQQIDLVLTGRVERRQADLRLQLTPSVEPQDSPEERAVTLYLSPMTLDGAEVNLIAPQGRFQEGLPPEGVVAHLIDVTERKSLEQQFAQAQKMQAMGQLAGGVAHDFNNLLTAMIGFSDLLLQRHGTGDPSFTDIMQIKQNANRAANLVRQLLAFSRRQPLRPRLLDVVDGLSELSHLLRRLLGERVELKLAHGREAGHIRVDPGQFDQVVINLAVNARDAMPNGGVLTISTRRDTLERPERRGAAGTVPAGDWVVIDVTDTGEGISREHLSRLFEPFFTTKAEGTAGSGTGLGLSTVYGIIRQTEGYIFVDSTQGEGATFTIYLPRFEGDEAEDHEVESDAILNAGEACPPKTRARRRRLCRKTPPRRLSPNAVRADAKRLKRTAMT